MFDPPVLHLKLMGGACAGSRLFIVHSRRRATERNETHARSSRASGTGFAAGGKLYIRPSDARNAWEARR